MMRYLVAAVVALAAALLLSGVLRNPSLRSGDNAVPSDELLAYDLAATSGVAIGLLRQTREVRLTTWCVVAQALPDQRFDYSVRVQWQDAAGKALGTSDLGFESRVSQPTPSKAPSSFATRLAYSNSLVTDSRTVRLLVPEFGGRYPAQLRLSPNHPSLQRILVRATFPESRPALEIAAVDRRLQPSERLELTSDRVSVDYDDLDYSLRSKALATWQRRLDASGIEGKDYRVERLLIGTGRTTMGLASAQRHTWLIHRGHALALNVRDRIQIQLSTTAHSSLQIATGLDQAPKPFAIDESGTISLEIGQPPYAQSVIVSSTADSPTPVRVSTTADQLGKFLGPSQEIEGSDRLAVAPLLRKTSYYALDPLRPISLRVAPGQKFLGLIVRGTHTNLQGRLEAEIDKDRAAIDVVLLPSVFEQWADEVAATDAQQLYLRIPNGTGEIALRGSAHLRISPFTSDPDIVSDRLAPEYDVPLQPETHWKFARYDVDRTVSLRPENELELATTGRRIELLAQSRVVGAERTGRQPESTLVPTTTAVERHVIEPVRWGPDIPLPEDVVVALERAHRAYVPARGPRAGRVRIAYRLAAESVGETLELLVDGAVVRREETVVSSGQFELPVTTGTHTFELRGYHGDSQALLEATPLEATGALRRRGVYRIAPGAVLRFIVNKQVDFANVIVTTYLQNERLVSMRYAISASAQQDFLHSVTPMQGEIAGVATEAPLAWYWESGPTKRLNRHRGVVSLGNDLAKGNVVLVLRNQTRTPVFVALVLVGQDSASHPNLQRFWTTEEP
jgi:hypothetical protein